jgi:hypothetical protein
VLWHERYGHLHFDTLRKLEQRGMVHGLPHIEHVHQLCADCVTIKLTSYDVMPLTALVGARFNK